jgi:hypothetical protein
MDNLQVFLLLSEENHAKQIYQGNGIFMPCGTPREMNVRILMTFLYDLTHTKTRD